MKFLEHLELLDDDALEERKCSSRHVTASESVAGMHTGLACVAGML